MHARPLRRRQDLLLLSAIVAGGCASPMDPVARAPDAVAALESPSSVASDLQTGTPGARSPAGFYPLLIGNRWVHTTVAKLQVVPNQGDAPPPQVFEWTTHREIVCSERIGMRSYLVERQRELGRLRAPEPDLSTDLWTRYRQDATGLYEAEVPISVPSPGCVQAAGPAPAVGAATVLSADELALPGPPAARAAYRAAWQQLRRRFVALRAIARAGPGGPADPAGAGMAPPGELTRLQYPLRAGASWVIRSTPFFGAVVEGAETLALPAGARRGFRIRIRSELFGPADVVRVWYGRAGFLQLAFHAEMAATDASGQGYGRVIWDEREALESAHLGPWVLDPLALVDWPFRR